MSILTNCKVIIPIIVTSDRNSDDNDLVIMCYGIKMIEI